MRYLIFLVGAILGLGAMAPVSEAQIAVSLSMERDDYIVYEPIPLVVKITNRSARPVTLENGAGGRSWLELQVFQGSANMIDQLEPLKVEDQLVIAPGQSLSRQINLTPMFALRKTGTFNVQAYVKSGKISAPSHPHKFSLTKGVDIKKVSVPVPGATEADDSYRTYALVLRRASDRDYLYAAVRDDENELVYAMLPLGAHIPMEQPQSLIDAAGNWHVIVRSGPRQMGYARVSPSGELLYRAVYTDLTSMPQLVRRDNGVVDVVGGDMIYPREERIMTEEELNPQPPPPPPKKKHWWQW